MIHAWCMYAWIYVAYIFDTSSFLWMNVWVMHISMMRLKFCYEQKDEQADSRSMIHCLCTSFGSWWWSWPRLGWVGTACRQEECLAGCLEEENINFLNFEIIARKGGCWNHIVIWICNICQTQQIYQQIKRLHCCQVEPTCRSIWWGRERQQWRGLWLE